MSSKKSEKPPPPGFPRPLAEISPTGSIIMGDHKRKAGERTFLGQRRSSRQKNPPNLFDPTHSHLSPRPRGQGLRCGPGRLRKNRSDESSASQPLRRGPGRIRKKRSDEVLEISSEEEETKSNAKLSRLMHPPKINHSPQILDEEMEKDFGGTQRKRELAKEKKETLKRQIEDLKTEVGQIEHEEERLKYDEIKYKEAYEAAKAKMQEVDTQLEAAQAMRRIIKHRKNVALQGIESTTQRLHSRFLDDLN